MIDATSGAPPVALTCHEIEHGSDWQALVDRACAAGNRPLIANGSRRFVPLPRRSAVRDRDGCEWQDGISIGRIWMGPRKHGITFVARRQLVSSGSPTRREPPGVASLTHTDAVDACREIADLISKHGSGLAPNAVPMVGIRLQEQAGTEVTLGGGVRQPAGTALWPHLKRHGFAAVPLKANVIVVGTAREARVARYAVAIQSALAACGLKASLQYVSSNEVAAAARSIADRRSGAHMFLVPVTGKRGQPLPASASRVIDALDAARQPYRLFSTDNPQIAWSANDQAGSILSALDGTPYRLNLPTAGRDYLYVGVDLGHPGSDEPSWLAVSLIDPYGVHVASCRIRQARDETAGVAPLKKCIDWLLRRIDGEKLSFDGIVVFRDGKLNDGESPDLYRRMVGDRLSILEVRKGGNPLMYQYLHSGFAPAPAGTVAFPAHSAVAFVLPSVHPATRNRGFPQIFKMNLVPGFDDLDLGLERAASIAVGLCYSPALGLQPHSLPAPIYWADGVAAIGPTNHQFSGQAIDELS